MQIYFENNTYDNLEIRFFISLEGRGCLNEYYVLLIRTSVIIVDDHILIH